MCLLGEELLRTGGQSAPRSLRATPLLPPFRCLCCVNPSLPPGPRALLGFVEREVTAIVPRIRTASLVHGPLHPAYFDHELLPGLAPKAPPPATFCERREKRSRAGLRALQPGDKENLRPRQEFLPTAQGAGRPRDDFGRGKQNRALYRCTCSLMYIGGCLTRHPNPRGVHRLCIRRVVGAAGLTRNEGSLNFKVTRQRHRHIVWYN